MVSRGSSHPFSPPRGCGTAALSFTYLTFNSFSSPSQRFLLCCFFSWGGCVLLTYLETQERNLVVSPNPYLLPYTIPPSCHCMLQTTSVVFHPLQNGVETFSYSTIGPCYQVPAYVHVILELALAKCNFWQLSELATCVCVCVCALSLYTLFCKALQSWEHPSFPFSPANFSCFLKSAVVSSPEIPFSATMPHDGNWQSLNSVRGLAL